MSRLLINKNQTADEQIYFNQDSHAVTVPKTGYHFSDDKSMDATVDYFIKKLGFTLVKQGKGVKK